MGPVSIHCETPGLDRHAVEIVVTIPTFRRPDHLLRTLDSVAQQATTRRVAIIVMENEAVERAGAMAAAPLFAARACSGLIVIAHERGNCHAYNAGWTTALAEFPNATHIAVLDDDECADFNWIDALLATAHATGAQIVGGPQVPVFDGHPPKSWTAHPVFEPAYDVTGNVPILYSSGNVLIVADVLRAMPRPFLDLAFNFTGGGDSDFYRRAKAMGVSFAWCEEAPVYETVPENRVTRDWIVKRAMRNGQLSALIEHRQRRGEPLGRVKTIAHSLVLAAASPLRAGISLVRTRSLLSALYPVHIAMGRIASEFGYANEQYRNPGD